MFDMTNKYLSEYYPLNRGVGDSNLFRFFVEKNLSMLKQNANLTYILPSAIFQDDGSIILRTYILEKYKLNYFFSFENNLPVFKDVHRSYKFAIMQITNGKTEIIDSFFYKTNPEDLWNKNEYINYSLEYINKIAPHHKNLFEIRSKLDLEIIAKAYAKFQPLNAEYFDFRRELDMTNDKSIFHEIDKNGFVPLFEGKTIHQFNPNFSKGKYFLNPVEFDKHILSKEIGRLVADIFPQLPNEFENWGKERAVIKFIYDIDIKNLKKEEREKTIDKLKEFVKFDREFFRIGFRAIARDTDERTIISTILPKSIGCGNSIYSEIPKIYILNNQKVETLENSISKKLFLLAMFNSITFDFLARLIVQINVNKTYFTRLPIPQPTENEFAENKIYKKIIENTKRLLTYHNDYGFENIEKPKNQKAYDMLRIENDIFIAKLYEIKSDELEHILTTFKVLNKNSPEFIETLKSKFAN